MGRVLAMGDIHGMYKALVQVLERAHFDPTQDQLIHLGDVADRGPELFECVELLIGLKEQCTVPPVYIRGNHDDWFLTWLRSGAHPGLPQGGRASVDSYIKHCDRDEGYMNDTHLNIPKEHLDFFTNQLRWHMDKELNIFVHGGFDRHKFLVDHDVPSVFWWDRDLWHTAMSYEAMQKGLVYNEPGGNISTFKIKEPCKEIFIGHTPTLLWHKDKPMKAANVNNLDTGAGMGGRLTIMDINTKEFWQSDFVNELYPPYATFEAR